MLNNLNLNLSENATNAKNKAKNSKKTAVIHNFFQVGL